MCAFVVGPGGAVGHKQLQAKWVVPLSVWWIFKLVAVRVVWNRWEDPLVGAYVLP